MIEDVALDALAHEALNDLAAELLAVFGRLCEALGEKSRILVANLEITL